MKLNLPYLNVIGISALSFCTFFAAVNREEGIANRTGSPGETTCATSNCHNSSPLNSGPGSITITSQIPTTGYVPGQTYSVSVRVAQSNLAVFGFDFEALNAANTSVGTLAVTSPETKLITLNNKVNVTHTNPNPVSTAGSKTFTFNWTAPSTRDNVTFYASGNAANGNEMPTGDFVYTTTAVINPAPPAAVEDANLNTQVLSVYPSPSTGQVTLNYNHAKGGEMAIELYDANGKMLQSLYSGITASGAFAQNFDLTSYTSGVYFIKVKTAEKVDAKMIVLN